MTFEYLYTTTAMGTLEIEDTGNVTINAVNSNLYKEYFLIIRTEYGRTKVIEYGPAFIDMNAIPTTVSYTYNDFDYSESKIHRLIENFLINPKYGIDQAQVVEFDDVKNRLKDLKEFL